MSPLPDHPVADWDLLWPLMEDLRGRVRHPGRLPQDQSIDLGRFLEDLCAALQDATGVKLSPDFSQLHALLGALNLRTTSSISKDLEGIYARRNANAHANPDHLRRSSIDRDLAELEEHLAVLCALLHPICRSRGTSLALSFYQTQAHATPQRRAQALNQAIAALPATPEVGLAIRAFVTPGFDEAALARLGRIPPEHQAAASVRMLATRGAAETITGASGGRDLLRALATHLRGALGHESTAALVDWMITDGQYDTAAPSPRLPTLSVWLDPGADAGYTLRAAVLLQPAIPGIERCLDGVLPIAVGSNEGLLHALMRVVLLLGTAAHNRPEGAHRLEWGRCVLHINTCASLADVEFESIGNERFSLSEYFRAVAVRPMLPDASGATVRSAEIKYPAGEGTNSVRFEKPESAREIFRRARDKAAAFYAGWAAERGAGQASPAVRAFDAHACSIVVCDTTLDNALSVLFPDRRSASIGQVFDRVASLRREQRVLLLWDDPEYRLPELKPL